MVKNKNAGKPRNYTLSSGVYRFGKSKTYHKKAIYKFLKKKTAKKEAPKRPAFIEKPVGGAKNGQKRLVRTTPLRKDILTQPRPEPGTSKNFFSKHTRSLRASLAPGVIAIVLAGVHKGKRVVILKQLATGLLLVTGPLKLNGCPMRRINQRYLLATSTRLDISKIKLDDKINDAYFRRVKAESSNKKPAKKEGDIFEAKKEEYKPSEQRKTDQAAVDKQILEVIAKHPDASMLKAYMKNIFSLSKGQFPHQMVF